MTNNDRLGIGFIGSGFMTRFHLRSWVAVRDADVLGIWSPNAAHRDEAASMARALGIGATSSVFSVVRGVVLKPLPYRDPARIVSIWETNVSRNQLRGIVAAANFVEWRERQRSFEYLGMTGPARLNFLLGGQPYEIVGTVASADVFNALGTSPVLGRTFTSEEDLEGRDDVIIVSDEFWRSRLGGAIAPKEIAFLSAIPKTRSGKIMRRLLKARELGLPEGDTSALEGPST